MFRHTGSLYIVTVLIWGSTFLAIKMQLGEVAVEASLTYRFGIASILLLVWCAIRKLPMRFNLKEHGWMATQGLLLFAINYLVVYWASYDLNSGLIAVVYSTIVLMNIANSFIFFGKRPNPNVLFSAMFGLVGICMVFWAELGTLGFEENKLNALFFALLSTFIASLGSMVSVRNQKAKLPVVQTNAYGMGYGSAALAIIAYTLDSEFTLHWSTEYLGSLVYLSLFGSVIAFGCYLTLVGRIGAEKASYTMVLFPIVALIISTLFEDYQWTNTSLMGVAFILLGNIINGIKKAHLSKASCLIKNVFTWEREQKISS